MIPATGAAPPPRLAAAPRAAPPSAGPGPGTGAARVYAAYAAGFLALTLLSGVWLRAVFVEPAAMGGFRFAFALHAHSHVAFFGWTTMALFAAIAAVAAPHRAARALKLHAHLVGLASAAAFVGFLQTGYAPSTIAISVLHVMLWIAFAFAAWPWLDDLAPLQRRFWRGSLVFLVLAGLGAMTPGVVMARQVADAWIAELSIKAFLTPFTSGWLLLGVFGAVYAAVERRGLADAAFWLVAVGVLPSTLLHTATPPPAEWMTMLGRAGTGLVGAGTLLFAADVLRSRGAAPLLRLAGVAAAVKGGAEVLAASGPLLELLASRQIGVAYLHLVLLGLVTPVLAFAGLGVQRAPRRVAAFAGGLAVMVGALVLLGWPALGAVAAGFGLQGVMLFRAALVGGAVCAVAGIALLPAAAAVLRRPAPDAPLPEPAWTARAETVAT